MQTDSVYRKQIHLLESHVNATIENHSNNTLKSTIYNAFGQAVKHFKTGAGETFILTRDNLSSGLYFIRLTEQNLTSEQKLILIE